MVGEVSYQASLLSFERYGIEPPKDLDAAKTQVLSTTVFYSLIFLQETALTSGSDGCLYLWQDKRIIKKQNAHPKAAILSLFASKNSRVFVSGAVDGKAIVWQVSPNSIFQEKNEICMHSGKDLTPLPKYQIQSAVFVGKNGLIVGTRSGEIHEFSMPNEEGEVAKNAKSKESSSLILPAFDDDMIVSCSFDISSQKLFVLTRAGVLALFNLAECEKIKEERIEIGNSEIVTMLACKLTNKLFIVLRDSIQVYQCTSEESKNSKPMNRFKKEKEHLKLGQSEIKAGILSVNEQFLAILSAPRQGDAAIQIYDLHKSEGDFYLQHKLLEEIPASIRVIDFSTDNGYLVYRSSAADETIIDLTTKESIDTDMIEFELEWNEEAKKTSPYIRDICSTYGDSNRLLRIAEIRNHSILATDEMGSVRVYRYRKESQGHEINYDRFYLEHLNEVFLCVLSSNCALLVTVGRCDRCIFIWKVSNFEKEEKPKSDDAMSN